jgi:hypothetical protein
MDEPPSAVIAVNTSLWLNHWVVIKQSCGDHIILSGAIETRNGRPAFPAEPSHIAGLHDLVYETLEQGFTSNPSENDRVQGIDWQRA